MHNTIEYPDRHEDLEDVYTTEDLKTKGANRLGNILGFLHRGIIKRKINLDDPNLIHYFKIPYDTRGRPGVIIGLRREDPDGIFASINLNPHNISVIEIKGGNPDAPNTGVDLGGEITGETVFVYNPVDPKKDSWEDGQVFRKPNALMYFPAENGQIDPSWVEVFGFEEGEPTLQVDNIQAIPLDGQNAVNMILSDGNISGLFNQGQKISTWVGIGEYIGPRTIPPKV